MTTTMFAPRTWVFNIRDREMRTARTAGWRRVDLWWERLSERGNRAQLAGDTGAALIALGLAWLLAATSFPRDDHRALAASANAAWIFRTLGLEHMAKRRYRAAAAAWAALALPGQELVLAPRARSSLFHMRMEALHAETYRANHLKRLSNFIAETGRTLDALAAGEAPGSTHYTRWRGEKPAIFDDSRKILSACLLVVV
ncbi:MAG: hypothetical protein RIC16_08175 [Rhodospirillales bacterium]